MKRSLFVLLICASACATPPPQKAEKEPILSPLFIARQRAIAQMNKNFERVHFEFDSSLLAKGSQIALAQNVEIMRRFPSLLLEVQGHCDERGSTEYNLALGQRRAESIKRYMTTAGVAPGRIATISYGEEVPIASAYAYNRRAEFKIRIAPTATLARNW